MDLTELEIEALKLDPADRAPRRERELNDVDVLRGAKPESGIARMSAACPAMIRPALPAEAELLSTLAFRSKAHWGYSAEFMEACRAELSITASFVAQHPTFVVVHDDRPVGFYTLEALTPTETELGHLFIEPAEHGKGLGRELVAHACEEACKRGFQVLVIQGDPNAAGFYEACGARRVGSRASASIPGRVLPLFEFQLCQPDNERRR